MSADWLTRQRLLLAAFLTATCLLLLLVKAFGPGNSEQARQARAALQRGDFDAACELADLAIRQRPGDVDSIAIGAEAAEKAGRLALAIDFLEWLPARVDDVTNRQLWDKKANLQERLGRISDARKTSETILQQIPDDVVCRRRLAHLLSGYGYRFEGLQHAETLLQNQQADLSDLVLLAKNGRSLLGRTHLERSHSLNPDDEMSTVSLLQLADDSRDAADARALLIQAAGRTSSLSPELLRRMLMFDLATSRSDSSGRDIGSLLQRLHQQAADHPETWLVTAEWARRNERVGLHQRCLIEAVQRDRWNSRTINALGTVFKGSAPNLSQSLTDLGRKLKTIGQLAGQISADPGDVDAMALIAIELNTIGRYEEARAWIDIQLRFTSNFDSILRTSATRIPDRRWRHPIEDLVDPLETSITAEAFATDVQQTPAAPLKHFLFEESSAAVGVRFRYDNGAVPEQQGLKMHQWTGGGVGIVDIDHDAWPDLYFTQGGHLFSAARHETASDELFRNQHGEFFVPIALMAGIRETEFGQGVAVGDVNNDGFEDLYVANVGINRLLLNQGDGTFQASDVSAGGSVWTTSVAIADLDGNGSPDLYDVNYLCGPNVFTATCDHNGYQRICGPTDFSAEPDRMLLSDGAGQYVRTNSTRHPVGQDGRGMGLVIGDLSGSGRNEIYVANDESGNQLFEASDREDDFQDGAQIYGLAFDHYGQAQGSMGIALGDVDRNGLPDLFVTNYYAESNVLYSQLHPSVFVDAAASAGLASPGYAMLGFGCQFLDIDSDGDLDLIVANGHLDDFSHRGHPYHMRPQLFCNDGSGRFIEAQPEDSFFRTPTLGRSVALLDWNRDGCCDFAVSELDSPSALVTNRTAQRAVSMQVSLIGVKSPRYPVGGTIVADTSGAVQTEWMTSGDGYECSNEHLTRLRCDGDDIPDCEVRWPGDIRQKVTSLRVGLNTVIEGRSTAYAIPK